MKRIILLIILLIIIISNSYASHESYITFGISFQNTINLEDRSISGNPIQTAGGNIGVLGLSINNYNFWNDENIGLFINCYYLFLPIYFTKNESDLTKYGSNSSNLIIGPGFKYPINNQITMLAGVGLNFIVHIVNYELKNNDIIKKTTINLGLGSQIGIKLDLTEKFCMMFLVNAGCDFINYEEKINKWTSQKNLAFMPSVCFGLNL